MPGHVRRLLGCARRLGSRIEAERIQKLAAAKAAYDQECREREAQAEAHNQELAKLINDLAFDVEDAIQDYVGIVLSNSAYPETFPVDHAHQFDLSTRELNSGLGP